MATCYPWQLGYNWQPGYPWREVGFGLNEASASINREMARKKLSAVNRKLGRGAEMACCGVMWRAMVCCDVLWRTLGFCGVLWGVVACCAVLWRAAAC